MIPGTEDILKEEQPGQGMWRKSQRATLGSSAATPPRMAGSDTRLKSLASDTGGPGTVQLRDKCV